MQEILVGSERISVGKQIGKGGEGEVFNLSSRPGQAVKIYNSQLRTKRKEKALAMVRAQFASKTNLIAFPHDIASDLQGNFLGFVMRLVEGCQPIHELYSPKSRQHNFPQADYRFIIRAAINVARAIGNVHQAQCVIGDLNHSGILVSSDATVALIDADSFQFQVNSKTYLCLVGVPEFTPPELQGINLKNTRRTVEHDNFGLAIVLFHLLFMGRHPYAGRYQGPDISMTEAIAQNRFAFSLSRRTSTQTTPPPGTLALEVFPVAIQNAFEQAFGLNPKNRPTASDWISVLTKLENSLSLCRKNSAHYYPSSINGCVWCNLLEKNKFDMFPDLRIPTQYLTNNAGDIDQAIKEILSFSFPAPSNFLPQPAVPYSGGSTALKEAKGANQGSMVASLLMIAGAGAGLFYATPLWFIWLGLAIWGWSKLPKQDTNHKVFQESLKQADKKVQFALDSFLFRKNFTEILKEQHDLDQAIKSYKNIEYSLSRELTSRKSTREARQRTAYLDKFPIRHSKISGIGPAKKSTLISFGVETAADIRHSTIIQIPGFGNVMTTKLVQWRRQKESQFRYDPAQNTQDIEDEKAVRNNYARQKSDLERMILSGRTTLQMAKSKVSNLPKLASTDQPLIKAIKEKLQAEQDLKLLGLHIPNSSVTVKHALQSSPSKTPLPPPITPVVPTKPARNHIFVRPANAPPYCPKCGANMRKRSGAYGNFWGCSNYPGCRGTRKI